MPAPKPLAELEQGLAYIQQAPADAGRVELIVCRPATNERRVLQAAALSVADGLAGDNWKRRGYRKSPGGEAHPAMQLTLMNARVMTTIAGDKEHWAPAGDQFYVDFDLSTNNVSPGTRLALGSAVIEVTSEPHLGCMKFASRFGKDATLFVNSDIGKRLNLRGINAKVVQAGVVSRSDMLRKLS